MSLLRQLYGFVRRFDKMRRGNVLLMTALMATVLTASVGVAIDYGRMVHFRNTLQGIVDAAAIAGATAYTSDASASKAQTIATNYVKNSSLPQYTGTLLPTITPSSTPAGYFMQVEARASIQTTFLAMWTSSVSIYANAKAENAIFNIQIKAGGWNSNAYDQNTVYYYLFDPANNVPPDAADMHTLFSNAPGFNNPDKFNLQVAASQQIAFAFKNITGGNHTYGINGYQGQQGSAHWFYSHYSQHPDTTNHYTTPNAISYPNQVANAGNQGQTYRPPSNCSLEVTTGTSDMTDPAATPPAAPATSAFDTASTGTCNDSTANPNFNDTKAFSSPSCSTLNKSTTTGSGKNRKTTYTYTYAQFNWNDMGGGTDDYDYNDGVFYISCPSPNGVAAMVTLVQ